MNFIEMLQWIKADPHNHAKREQWEWANVAWHPDRGPWRGDTFNGTYVDMFKREDWLADDWVKCGAYGQLIEAKPA